MAAGTLRAGRLTFFSGSFSQAGGAGIIDTMTVPEQTYKARGSYGFSGGTLVSGSLTFGSWFDPLAYPNDRNPGSFRQSGGVHTVENATKSATNLFHDPQQYFQLRSREE